MVLRCFMDELCGRTVEELESQHALMILGGHAVEIDKQTSIGCEVTTAVLTATYAEFMPTPIWTTKNTAETSPTSQGAISFKGSVAREVATVCASMRRQRSLNQNQIREHIAISYDCVLKSPPASCYRNRTVKEKRETYQ